MDDNIEYTNLFNDLMKEKNIKPSLTTAEQIVQTIENDFGGSSMEEKSRIDEEECINIQIKTLENTLTKYKNIKNHNDFRHK